MDTTVFLLLFAVAVVVFVGFIFYMRGKRIKESWKGTVVDKKVLETTSSNGGASETTTYIYNLSVKTVGGQEKRITVSKSIYDSLDKGDTVEKKSGAYDPVKV